MSDTLRISLHAIRAVAGERLPGYVDAVLARSARPVDTHVYLTAEAYVELQQKFRAGPIIGKPPPVPVVPKSSGFDGSALWRRLHTTAAATQALIDGITAEIPCGPCKSDWLAMLARTPPLLGNLPAFRAWGVDRHSEVSLKIGKEAWTYSRAAARWGW